MCSPADDGWIEMDFPADPTAPAEPPPSLDDTLGLRSEAMAGGPRAAASAPGVRAFARGGADVVIELAAPPSCAPCTPTWPCAGRAGLALCHRHRRRRPARHRLCRVACSRPMPASPRTPSPAPPTAPWRRTGATPRSRRVGGGTGLGARRRGADAAGRGSGRARRSGRHGLAGPPDGLQPVGCRSAASPCARLCDRPRGTAPARRRQTGDGRGVDVEARSAHAGQDERRHLLFAASHHAGWQGHAFVHRC